MILVKMVIRSGYSVELSDFNLFGKAGMSGDSDDLLEFHNSVHPGEYSH